MNRILIILAAVAFLAAGCNRPPATFNEQTNQPQSPSASTVTDQSIEFATINPTFKFSGRIPAGWRVEYIAATDALNIYNPAASAESNLEKSQIFVRHFTASSFLTLSTVDILAREETSVGNRPAVKYEIRKKPGVADFANQPNWRSHQHKLIDIRLKADNPSLFYVFAYNPNVDPAVFDQFIADLVF